MLGDASPLTVMWSTGKEWLKKNEKSSLKIPTFISNWKYILFAL